jgi:hypothetical protein
MEEPCVFVSRSVECVLADGRHCPVRDTVRLHVKLASFSWDHEFMVLPGGAFPAILGLDFLQKTQMLVDVASREYEFRFAPDFRGKFSEWGRVRAECPFLQSL